ncbi:MAG: hypothetical protein ACI4SN_08145 [Lachnospiraceae bacterium]
MKMEFRIQVLKVNGDVTGQKKVAVFRVEEMVQAALGCKATVTEDSNAFVVTVDNFRYGEEQAKQRIEQYFKNRKEYEFFFI